MREQVRRWNARQHFLVSGILIGLNVAVFLIGMARASKQGFSGTEWNQNDYGLYGPSIRYDHEWYRIITSGFLHASFFHILMNMAALAQLGRLLEVGLGRLRFLLVYIVSLIAGSAGALIVTPDSLTVGASGAIFGLLGALAIAFHRRGISIWQTGIGGILVINLLVTFAVPGISIGGHLGGLVGGGVAGYALMQTDAKGRPTKAGIPLALAVGVAAFAIALAAAGQS